MITMFCRLNLIFLKEIFIIECIKRMGYFCIQKFGSFAAFASVENVQKQPFYTAFRLLKRRKMSG